MKTKAVINRFDRDKSVFLVGDEKDRLTIVQSLLPPGAREGRWLQVDVEDNRVLNAAISENATAEAKIRIEEKHAKLRRGDRLKL